MSTKIEWVKNKNGSQGITWNPVTGCSKISEGCQNCYAERMSKRLAGRCGYPANDPFHVTLHPKKLSEPFFWTKKRTVFVCSMSDLFHDDVPFEFIDEVFRRAMTEVGSCMRQQNSWHDFIFLTKRPHRMLEFWEWHKERYNRLPNQYDTGEPGISPHIWIGATVENQPRADERIPVLLQIPSAVHFVSVEPMLSHVNLNLNKNKLDWVICGGETGPHARPIHPDWVRALRFQCQIENVSFFFKSCGEFILDDDQAKGFIRVGKKAAGRLLDGRTWDEMPDTMKK